MRSFRALIVLTLCASAQEPARPAGTETTPAGEPALGQTTPGEGPRETPAETLGETSGESPGETPGEAPGEAPGDTGEPAPVSTPPAPSRYHTLEESEELFASWLGSGLAERVELGVSAGGRPLVGVQFGGRGARPLDERTTVLLLGGLDGVSIAGTEAVVSVTSGLLARADLPPDVAFLSVPWANPDGLRRWIESGCGDGRNDAPVDDDRDGSVDEDGPDDMDGDGAILELLIEDPDGMWTRSSDGRFLRVAEPRDTPRYRWSREGRDDDGDGRFNEDPPGGVAVDRNFPLGWRGPWEGRPSGPRPLSEPASRALSELARKRRIAIALVFQGNHGRIAMPGAAPGIELPEPRDEPAFRAVAEAFARTTGRKNDPPLRLEEAWGAPRPGAAIDWLYAALGVLAVEVAVWGPEVEGGQRETVDAQFVRGRGKKAEEPDRRELAGRDRAWASWLDDTRGGMGFVDWQPVDLGEGRRGLVGGWESRSCWNPRPETLGAALQGMDAFVLELAQRLPSLSIEVRDARREGRVVFLNASVRNLGRLPSCAGPGATTELRLPLPAGAELLAGEERIDLGVLPGGTLSREISWILVAPEGTLFRLVARHPWGDEVVREVRM